MSGLEKGANVFLGGLIAIAIFAVLVSNKSQTPAVLGSAGTALSSSLSAAQQG
jgi:hypothetical protein